MSDPRPSVPTMTTTARKTVPRERASHKCAECGWTSPRWVGRCGECQTWGSMTAATAAATAPLRMASVAAGPVTTAATSIMDVDVVAARAQPSGLGEFDRVLGGGFVAGSVVLVAGEPGVGKSTLLLEVAARSAATGPVLYVTGEESAAQVRLRAERVGAMHPKLMLAAETDLAAVLGHIDAVSPSLLIVDSVQTVASAAVDGSPGGVAQVREVAGALIRSAKDRGMTTVLVGHVTKDGSVAGPRTLEHLVDVVLYIEGDRHARLRLVRAQKNRFGPSDEVGCFDLGDDGIRELPDPSELFMTRRSDAVPGTCITVAMEGTRPLVAEVQALIDPSKQGSARRNTSGLDSSRVAMVLAVLERHARVNLRSHDTYTATVGGVRLGEPAADLAIALAVASGSLNLSVPLKTVVIGEVGLAGEVRRVSGLQRRLAEAQRLGFTDALVPVDTGPIPKGIRVHEIANVTDATHYLVSSNITAEP